MKRKTKFCSIAAALTLAVGCAGSPETPLSPSGTSAGAGLGANADGSTLKVSAPAAQSPANGETASRRPSFTFSGSSSSHGVPSALAYRVQVYNEDGSLAGDSFGGSSPLQLGGDLDAGKNFTWRVRAEQEGAHGPWSGHAAFRTQAAATPAAPAPASGDGAQWSNEQWQAFFFALIQQKGLGSVSPDALWALRPEITAHGADFQNAWRGDIRPRLFLPVAGCPTAINGSDRACTYSRTVDIGNWGGGWGWLFRGQT